MSTAPSPAQADDLRETDQPMPNGHDGHDAGAPRPSPDAQRARPAADEEDRIERLRAKLGLIDKDDEPEAQAPPEPRQRPQAEDRLIPLAPPPPQVDDDDDDDDDDDESDEEVGPESERFAPESPEDLAIDTSKKKVCRSCGKDLRGHRRFKDSKGYLCATCEAEDRVRRIACAECGKPVPPEQLRPWGPISICNRCFIDHENDPKARVRKKISTKNFELAEKQNILIMAGVAAVLLAIIALSQLGC